MLRMPPTRITGTLTLYASTAAKSAKYASFTCGIIPGCDVSLPLTSIESIPLSDSIRQISRLSSSSSPPRVKSLQLIFAVTWRPGASDFMPVRISVSIRALFCVRRVYLYTVKPCLFRPHCRTDEHTHNLLYFAWCHAVWFCLLYQSVRQLPVVCAHSELYQCRAVLRVNYVRESFIAPCM